MKNTRAAFRTWFAGSDVLLGSGQGWAERGVWRIGRGQVGTRHGGMKRHLGFSGRPQQPAGQPSTLQVGTDQAGGPIEVFENPLGGEVSAADRALHRRWPAGIGPVT